MSVCAFSDRTQAHVNQRKRVNLQVNPGAADLQSECRWTGQPTTEEVSTKEERTKSSVPYGYDFFFTHTPTLRNNICLWEKTSVRICSWGRLGCILQSSGEAQLYRQHKGTFCKSAGMKRNEPAHMKTLLNKVLNHST